MPKNPIDYSKTKIYKIVCKDLNINLIYVGSTTCGIVKRKGCHKAHCNNEKATQYNYKIYKQIRENKADYYKNNIETFKKKNEEYYKNNAETILERHADYYKNNKEAISEYKKDYYKNNYETINQKARTRYQINKEKIKQQSLTDLLLNGYIDEEEAGMDLDDVIKKSISTNTI